MSDHPKPPAAALAPNLQELLRWIDDRPRTYAETMDAWRTSCPKLPAWEDAIDHGLVLIDASRAARQDAAAVRLTARGKAALRTGPSPAAPLPFAAIMAFMQLAST